MALSDPRDTLAYHRSRPLFEHRNMAHAACSSVIGKMNVYVMGAGEAQPEVEAVSFYAMNQAAAMLSATVAPLQPLTEDEEFLIGRYTASATRSAVRAFYYLLAICTREARHLKNPGSILPMVGQQFGDPVRSFFSGSGGEGSIYARLLKTPPNAPIGKFTDALCFIFNQGSWSPGYGGKAWGEVASCLNRFVHGETSAEMMMDTVWTLAHNNGPIFNKGIFYNHYTNDIYKILDVQRSGQMVEFALSGKCAHVSSEAFDVCAMVKKMYGDQIGDYVDWIKVRQLGALHNYAAEEAKQVELHGLPDGYDPMTDPGAASAVKKAAGIDKSFEYWPGQHVPVIKRAA